MMTEVNLHRIYKVLKNIDQSENNESWNNKIGRETNEDKHTVGRILYLLVNNRMVIGSHKKGYQKQTVFYKMTPDGLKFLEELEVYVKTTERLKSKLKVPE